MSQKVWKALMSCFWSVNSNAVERFNQQPEEEGDLETRDLHANVIVSQ